MKVGDRVEYFDSIGLKHDLCFISHIGRDMIVDLSVWDGSEWFPANRIRHVSNASQGAAFWRYPPDENL